MDDTVNNPITSGLSVETEVLPYEKPVKFVDIPKEVIDSFSAYMQLVLKVSAGTKHRDVDVKNILENTKCMFRDGVKHNDAFWMQHTASSFREIIDFVDVVGEDFYKAHKSIPPYATNNDIKEQLDRIVLIRSYLSDIVHFALGNRLGLVHKIYPTEGYGVIRKEKFFAEEGATFEKICIDFIYILNDIFLEYCVGVVVEEIN